MAEKADLPSDSVSLPPTYAPSETFTESPPPAYKRPGMAAVRVARIVCFTLLAMTFIIGLFVITHKWIQNTEINPPMDESNTVQHAALFGEALNLFDTDLSKKEVEENIVNKKATSTPITDSNTGERFRKQQQIAQSSESEKEKYKNKNQLLHNGKEQMDQLFQEGQLPKNILGNNNLSGRNVHCKVEKRHRKISEGITTQAIIVTCDDVDENDNKPREDIQTKLSSHIIPARAPMSLLSSIMNVLSDRSETIKNKIPREEARLIPFPFLRKQDQGSIPMIRPIRGPVRDPFPGRIQSSLSPIFVPLRNIKMQRPFPTMENKEFNALHLRQYNHHQHMNDNRESHMNNMFPLHSFIQSTQANNVKRLSFPPPNEPLPVRIIRLPQMENYFNEEENIHNSHQQDQNEGHFPLNIRPMMKHFPSRKILFRLRQKESLHDLPNELLPFSLTSHFPRVVLPTQYPLNEPPMPHRMPAASGRALPSPVALPGVRVVRLPFIPQHHFFNKAKVSTHMEVHPPQGNKKEPENFLTNSQSPNRLEDLILRHNNKEFGPPKIHTVIGNAPLNIFGEDRPQEEFSSREYFHQPQSLATPLPSFIREGLTRFLSKLNPDSEVTPKNQDENLQPNIHRIVLN